MLKVNLDFSFLSLLLSEAWINAHRRVLLGKRFWSFPRWTGDSGSSQRERLPDRICEISESSSQMVLQFHSQVEVSYNVRIFSCQFSSILLSTEHLALFVTCLSSSANLLLALPDLNGQRLLIDLAPSESN